MNALTDARAFVENRLFATLDTRTRLWNIRQGRRAFLSDTVGFIRDLPHHLVASFHATLAEARHAHVLLHVVDVSHPDVLHQVESVRATLDEIDCHGKPVITVLNKCDILRDYASRVILDAAEPGAVLLSAATGEGLSDLERAVADFVDSHSVRADLRWPVADGRILAFLSEHATVLAQDLDSDTQSASVQTLPAVFGRLKKRFPHVRFERGFRPPDPDADDVS